jgi:hypothetical protein
MRSLVERGIRALVLALLLAGSARALAADASGAPGADASPETTLSALPDSIPMIQNSQLRLDPNEIRITGVGNGSLPWTIIVLLTFLTLIPSLL